MRRSIFGLAVCLAFSPIAAQPSDAPFSADDVLKGVKANRGWCSTGHDRLWVEVDGEGDCLRVYGKPSVEGGSSGLPLIFLEGDVVYRGTGAGQDWMVSERYSRLSPNLMQAEAEQNSASLARPFVSLARPGTFGSSGDHMKRRREREVALVNEALDRLKRRFGWTRLDLAGFSGGGHLVGALMARRSDIRCAVIASGNVAVRQRARALGLEADVTGYADFVDPIDHVGDIARRPPERIIVLTDPQDAVVPAVFQEAFVDALRQQGVAVEHRFITAFDPGHHVLRWPAFLAAAGCGSG